MDLKDAIRCLDKAVNNAKTGLPDELFYFVTRLTPMVNVDLLVKDSRNRTLLAWRKDTSSGAGWHVPGGIVRYKEKLEDRIKQVSIKELGIALNFSPMPIAINQLIQWRDTRGHFISFLYYCKIEKELVPNNKDTSPNTTGYLKWHENCPDNLVRVHKRIYSKFIKNSKLKYLNEKIPVNYFDKLNAGVA